jgi:hypothetical protein
MTERINIILAIRELCELFAPHTEDRTTLDEIVAISLDRSRWKQRTISFRGLVLKI